MCEKLQGIPVGNQENATSVEGPRISPGVENMFFSNFYIRSQLMAAKSKLIERIGEIDIDGSVWEILTEKECNKRHKKFLTKKEMCTVICHGEQSTWTKFSSNVLCAKNVKRLI